MSVTEEQVLAALRHIQDPDLHKDIVTLGFIKDLSIDGGRVGFTIELTTPACPVKERFESEAKERVGAIDGVTDVAVALTSSVKAPERSGPTGLPGVAHTVAVASGKGGVGKSTVAVNLAVSLARAGARVGLLDADVYGPSIPIMLGVKSGRLPVRDGKIVPLQAHGIHLVSLGFIAPDSAPVVWRGPMVHKALQQFLNDVHWGELDYLVVDLPPGTGDAQLTLSQGTRLSGAVIVTTPQDVALEDVRRGVRMFETVDVPVLGVVENMSFFACESCGHRHEIFAHGGGRTAAESFGIPFLGEIPLDTRIREGGDSGVPVAATGAGPQAEAFAELAGTVARCVSMAAHEEPIHLDR